MATDFNVEPFYDDFLGSNGAKEQNYVRILFRPGYAVQARELTQIQTIIQNQIKQFGDHIFKNGSPVFGGHITYDLNVPFVKLQTAYNGADVEVEDYENAVIRNVAGTAKVRAKVIATDDTQTNPTLMIKYLRGTKFVDNEVISNAESGGSEAKLLASAATGFGSVASIQPGVFYVDGFFVQVPEQSIVLDAYGNTPSFKVGLEIVESIVDESADANLLDPAQASFNYQAPGAHRYQFRLDLAKRTIDSADDTKFFELLRIENGVITKQVKYPIYSELEKTLARRTYDESGDYTVSPFKVSLEANTACTDNFIAVVEPGKAYVKGFEYEAIGPQRLVVQKPRTKQTSTDFDLSLEYGNYLYANTLTASANGMANTAALPVLELHCVPKNSINTTGTVGYNTTFMGTAKLKHIARNNGTEYIVYLSDISLVSNTVTAASGGANTLAINFPATYSTLDGAYTNVSVKITSGGSTGDVRKIVSYNGTTKVGVVDLPFTGIIGTSQTFSLVYSTRDIDALVDVVGSKAAFNVSMNVSNNSKDITNGTILYDTNRKTLIFRLPEPQIANNSIDDADYVSNKFLTVPFNTSGIGPITLAGSEVLDYGSDGSTLSTTAINQNFIIVIRSLGTATAYTSNSTAVSVGDIITPASITRSSPTGLSVNSGLNGSFNADVYVRVKNDNSEDNIRTKTKRGNVANTKLVATSAYTNGTAVTGCTSVYIDSTNGHVWFTNTGVINTTPGGATSLFVPDAYKLIKIYDSGNPSNAPTLSNAIDVTSSFFLDTGQTSEYYDHAKIILKPGRSPPRGQIVVFVEYYEHSGSTGYFNVDSYPPNQYANGDIGIFKADDGTSYPLRDSIDFRPTRIFGSTANTYVGAKIPLPYESMEMTYQYYLPRKDKIIVTSSKELKVISGIPAKNPQYPPEQADGMTLFTMDLPAYTSQPNHVIIKAIDNKRYTMRDIGKLEQRIKAVEYYSALSLVETKAKDSTILYEDNATQKEKYGIVTDNFTGFDVGDTKNRDFACAIEGGKLKPYSKTVNVNLVPLNPQLTLSADPALSKKSVWSIPAGELIINNQTAATKNTAVIPPVLAAKFEGDVGLFPSTDHYFSVVIPPVIISETKILPPPDPPYIPPSPPITVPEAPIIVYSPPPPPVLDVRVEPALPPPVVIEPVRFDPPPPPPVYVPPPPPPVQEVVLPLPCAVLVREPYPRPEDVGEIFCITPPPLPPTPPPTPPPVVIDGFGPIPIYDIIMPPFNFTIPDITGAAPEVAVIDTWYQAPVGVAADIFPESGGGGDRFNEFEMIAAY